MLFCFTHVVAQERISFSEYLWEGMLRLQDMFAQRRQITSEVEVSLLVVSIIIYIRYPALAVTLDVYVTRVQINSRVFLMKTKSKVCFAFRNKRLSTLLLKITPSSEQQVTGADGCCKAPKSDVPGAKTDLILVVFPKCILV
jgi:hypothetical protein